MCCAEGALECGDLSPLLECAGRAKRRRRFGSIFRKLASRKKLNRQDLHKQGGVNPVYLLTLVRLH